MTLSMWRNGFHKFIVVLGFMALFAVASGAVNTPKPLGEASLIGGLYHPLPHLLFGSPSASLGQWKMEIRRNFAAQNLAESEGFEPSSPAKGCQFSRLVYSTALPALRRPFYWFRRGDSSSCYLDAVLIF